MSALEAPPRLLLEPLVRAALLEDFGRAGDITSMAVVPAEARARFAFVAREAGILAGLPLAALAFALIEKEVAFTPHAADGERIGPGDTLALVEGPARAILGAERVALNFLGHLSGIATATRSIADLIAHTKARIVCTRKTTPLLRIVEKYAVRAGGGVNHRFGLDDGLLIKDNHIALAGSVREAVERARASAGHMVMIEVEVETLDQLDEALAAGAAAVLLDNMELATLRAAVGRIAGTAIAEASGRVRRETAAAIAETGVDLLSSGAITHSAPSLDIGLDRA